jgi:hypothetical protein
VITETAGWIVAMGYTHTVSLFITLGNRLSTLILRFSFNIALRSKMLSVFTATKDNSVILGLPQFFNPVASRSQ